MASNPPTYEEVEQEDQQREVVIDLSESAPTSTPDSITVSVTDGANVIGTFDIVAPPELSIKELRVQLTGELHKIDESKKIRLLIFRGQILRDDQAVGDTKIQPGDTLQMLTAADTPPPPEPSAASPTSAAVGGDPRSMIAQLGMLQHPAHQVEVRQPGDPTQISLQGIELQEEVEIWASRVKMWTCMLLMLYSFKLLVGISQSMEQREREHSSTVAFDLLGFWVAYVGARAATRLNLALARGYLYGQVMVGACNIFLLAMREPGATADGEEIPYNMVWISIAINCLFWGYIIYGAFRFQRALFLWFTEVHPELIMMDHSEM